MHRLAAALFALLAPSITLAQGPIDRVGDAYEIRIRKEAEASTDWGSSSRSQSNGIFVERVVAIDAAGVQLEFDLPASIPADQRATEWQFPALVLKSGAGTLTLLNEPELQQRNRDWLKAAKLTSDQCGTWYFTWNAFKVECDPQSALDIIAPYDLRFGGLKSGALYNDPNGLAPVALRQEGSTLVAELALDPEAVRRERAEQDVILAQIMREPAKTFDAALKARAGERISGSIVVQIDTDLDGHVTHRLRITTMTIVSAEGTETTVITETTNRRRLTPAD